MLSKVLYVSICKTSIFRIVSVAQLARSWRGIEPSVYRMKVKSNAQPRMLFSLALMLDVCSSVGRLKVRWTIVTSTVIPRTWTYPRMSCLAGIKTSERRRDEGNRARWSVTTVTSRGCWRNRTGLEHGPCKHHCWQIPELCTQESSRLAQSSQVILCPFQMSTRRSNCGRDAVAKCRPIG